MRYRSATILYSTGTGNSARVAHWLSQNAKEEQVDSRIQSIEVHPDLQSLARGADHLFGFAFPTHGFTAPWHMLKFALKMPWGNGSHAFCVATRGRVKLGRVFVPGLSGSATFVVALFLFLRGYRIRGVNGIDMPSNWYSLHPVQSRESHGAIIGRAEYRTRQFMAKILAGRYNWFTLNNLYEATGGVLLSLISVAYLFMGRFFLAKLFFANNDCDGCGICAANCPVGAIRIRGKERPRPFWRYNCESCMRCGGWCPKKAIEAGQSWGVILYFITAVPLSAWFFTWLSGFTPGIESIRSSSLGFLLNYLHYYPGLVLAYFVFDTLLRIPAVNWLFANTTLTHIPRWGRYREPDTRLSTISHRKGK